jgi:trimeric autotransporter adhesin
VFNSNNWNQTGTIDPTQYVGFSITSNAGFHLNLTDLTFDARRSATGPLNIEVALFLNGSSTAYATLDFAPAGSLNSQTFDFADLTDGDNVTSATFKFFGWNAGGSGGQFEVDNVAINGAISSLPEIPTFLPVICLMACVLMEGARRKRH